MKRLGFIYMVVVTFTIGIVSFSLPLSAKLKDRSTGPTSEEELSELKGLGVRREVQGRFIDLSLPFTNEEGDTFPLSHYFNNPKQSLLVSLVYFSCPSLCTLHLNALAETVQKLKLKAGKDFRWLVISFDANEGSELAKEKKKVYTEKYGDLGWEFLTAKNSSIEKLTQQLDFRFRWSKELQEWAHSSGVFVFSAQGQISNYLQGLYFTPRTLRLALVEAAAGTLGSWIDQFSLFCFRYNPHKNKYTLYAESLMRTSGGVMVLLLFIYFIFLLRHSLRERSKEKSRMLCHSSSYPSNTTNPSPSPSPSLSPNPNPKLSLNPSSPNPKPKTES